MGGDVETSDIWGLDEEEIESEIRAKIESCGIFVQLLGSSYGPVLPDEPGDLSYLQYEHSCAELAGKQIHLILVGPDCDRDQAAEVIDCPLENCGQPEANRLLANRRALQEGYLRELAASGYELLYAENDDEARDAVFQIWSRPDEMRKKYLVRKAGQKKRKRNHVIIAVALGVVAIGAVWLASFISPKPNPKPKETVSHLNPVNPATLARVQNVLVGRAINGFKDSVGKGSFIFDRITDKEKFELAIYRDRYESIQQFTEELTKKSVNGTLSEDTKKILILMQDDSYEAAPAELFSTRKENLLAEIRTEVESGNEGLRESAARSFLLDMISLAGSEGDLTEARHLAELALKADPQWRAARLSQGRITLSRVRNLGPGINRQMKLALLKTSAEIASKLVESRSRDPEALKFQIQVGLDLVQVSSGSKGKGQPKEKWFEDFKNLSDQCLNYQNEFPNDPDGGLLMVKYLYWTALEWIGGGSELVLRMNRDRHFRAIEELESLKGDLKNKRKYLRMEMELFRSLSQLPLRISRRAPQLIEENFEYLKRAVKASSGWDTHDPSDFESIWSLVSNQISLGDALMVPGDFSNSFEAEKSYRAALHAARIYREQSPDDLVALNLYCRAAIKLGGCLQKLGSSGESGPAFEYLEEAFQRSSASYKDEPRNGFAILGYLASLQAKADYLRSSSELVAKGEAQKLAGTAFQIALDYYREHPGDILTELHVRRALLRLQQVHPLVKDSALESEAEDQLMETLEGLMADGRTVSRPMAELYEELRLKKK